MERPGPVVAIALLGLSMLAIGVWRDLWWPLAGGVTVLALAAWLATEDAPP